MKNNEQSGNPENLELVVVKNSLSECDKEQIKEAVLKNAINLTCLYSSELAKDLIEAIKLINQA
ncbi:hypothetical protein B0186_04005 [Canicola haemoglobinophilus]|uniref:Uncharacterized protein n=1 Tax=Canicola haemoglobinophilus TaxID=733 RepID=A0A1V4B205_9PAST|nr:hypothetical protein [Canicola haemoglobinophilus]OOS01250.1 hypothetical protein B0186_04005 [Canicola haemoglobinophilus]STO54436.1 Uncharacterised protein [Canicola haemoglobinophilus]STO60090.1 Uncharacterised protein [Canicola haemoglobinophilus]STO68970.1 Uncharacterised protein [Canicola haemoglobinophilus]